jgi:hypothetical protein
VAQTPNKIGSAATTAAAKTSEMILGGDCGSDLKMWWISGSAAYRRGASGTVRGTLVSRETARSKTLLLYGVEEPNEPMTIEAVIGSDAVRNWWGRSL